ncbi:histidine kinase [Aquimarina sp. BL5]|uniref:2TM domain-containing protein n=1 Tax=Aquimarina sp. BL5 TaxID=1714860 RepID=UPI000E4D01D9|nr:2TM domain-containing protein [Aquimarina sp. BL5]AXT50646.1 histidine kinase [Aquimarina sp. BL5]RKN07117.1 histidine kinase [Aquimarina sp. BL5]
MENSEQLKTYIRAQKRVAEERNFYTHLAIYIVINIIIFAVILELKDYIYDGYLWINLLSTPVLWGIPLLIHGVWAFRKGKKLTLFKKWEDRKIKEYMNKENNL